MYREGENDGHCAEGQLALSQQPDKEGDREFTPMND